MKKNVTATIPVSVYDTLFCNISTETCFHEEEVLPQSIDVYDCSHREFVNTVLYAEKVPVNRVCKNEYVAKWVMDYNTFIANSVSAVSRTRKIKYIGRTVKTRKIKLLLFDGKESIETAEGYFNDSVDISAIKSFHDKMVLKIEILQEIEEQRYVSEAVFVRNGRQINDSIDVEEEQEEAE